MNDIGNMLRHQRLKAQSGTGEIGAGSKAMILAADSASPGPFERIRLTVRLTENQCRQVAVRLRPTGELVACFDIRYPVARQCFEAVLSRPVSGEEAQEGFVLEAIGDNAPLEIALGLQYPMDAPHLLGHCPLPIEEAARLQLEGSSVSEIGWMEGCILEGLKALGTGSNLVRARLGKFFDRFGEAQGIEGTLPVATLAANDPDHPAIEQAVELWNRHRTSSGAVLESGRLAAETCLTVAYPLAVIARAQNAPHLAGQALDQLAYCRNRLQKEDAIALRRFETGEIVYPNWSRGVGWFLLGHAMTVRALDGIADVEEATAAAHDACREVVRWQQPDGLWRSFLDDAQARPETSGSALIGAACAMLAKETGDPQLAEASRRALAGMGDHFAPDGLLDGATQHNCGGEELQRGSYRVAHPYVLGLYFLLQHAVQQIE